MNTNQRYHFVDGFQSPTDSVGNNIYDWLGPSRLIKKRHRNLFTWFMACTFSKTHDRKLFVVFCNRLWTLRSASIHPFNHFHFACQTSHLFTVCNTFDSDSGIKCQNNSVHNDVNYLPCMNTLHSNRIGWGKNNMLAIIIAYGVETKPNRETRLVQTRGSNTGTPAKNLTNKQTNQRFPSHCVLNQKKTHK